MLRPPACPGRAPPPGIVADTAGGEIGVGWTARPGRADECAFYRTASIPAWQAPPGFSSKTRRLRGERAGFPSRWYTVNAKKRAAHRHCRAGRLPVCVVRRGGGRAGLRIEDAGYKPALPDAGGWTQVANLRYPDMGMLPTVARGLVPRLFAHRGLTHATGRRLQTCATRKWERFPIVARGLAPRRFVSFRAQRGIWGSYCNEPWIPHCAPLRSE